MDLSYTLLGIVVGTLVGITGVGGGSLVTPEIGRASCRERV